MKGFNIYLTGVGGQGIGLISEIVLRAVDHVANQLLDLLPAHPARFHHALNRGNGAADALFWDAKFLKLTAIHRFPVS